MSVDYYENLKNIIGKQFTKADLADNILGEIIEILKTHERKK